MIEHGLIWLRRDLRLDDHPALQEACVRCQTLSFLFIFDTDILDSLPQKDPRLQVIGCCLNALSRQLPEQAIFYAYGRPEDLLLAILRANRIRALFFNEDYEPQARKRDETVKTLCRNLSVQCFSFKDQVIFGPQEIVKENGKSYEVFTAYQKRWLQKTEMHMHHPESFDNNNLPRLKPLQIPHQFALPSFLQAVLQDPEKNIEQDEWSEPVAIRRWKKFCGHTIRHYAELRNRPDLDGTSRMSVALRFGTISVRRMLHDLMDLPAPVRLPFLNELIWREFFKMILYHHPHVVSSAYRSQYDRIRWMNREDWFERWKKGQTGYPLVDAGMRQLNTTGWMHNRVRMITASFLVKHLHIDWRWGEGYFAEKLLDYELSSNNGNWQWAAGTGVDAAPYFRIFHPIEQGKKFDPEGEYIRRWVPELQNVPVRLFHSRRHHKELFAAQKALHPDYIAPIIDLDEERKVALILYRR